MKNIINHALAEEKKLFTLMLAVAASVGTMFASTKIGGLYYNLDATNQTAEVTDQDGNASGEIIIPSSVTYNSVSYSVTNIGSYAFYECSSLTSVTIPNSVTSIGYEAFSGCSNITSIVWNVKNYPYCDYNNTPFYYNYDNYGQIQFDLRPQITSFTFGNEVEQIPAYLCNGMSNLTSIEIPNSVTSIGNNAFRACSSLTSVTIGNSVTSIGSNAFSGCSGLTSVTIPNSVTSIGESAFYGCASLTSVTIGNSVTSIGWAAFAVCTGLTSVTIPNSVTSIGEDAFAGCTGLTSVTCFATTPPQLDKYVFDYVDKSTCVLYVPAGSISAYQSADGWKDFTNILPIGAQPADVTTTTVTPSATTADIAWPQVTGAATYTIEIKKNEELICTLTFNAQGQLISIAFAAPSRNNAPQQAQAAGFAFTVTSLDSGTTYSYTMTAKGNNGNVLKTESGTFTTTGESQGFEDVQGNNVQCTKIVHNGQIFILRGEKVYTIDGCLVR